MILNILNELASTLSIKEKEAILTREKNNALLKEIFRITYTKQIMFHIKKFPTELDTYSSVWYDLEWAVKALEELSSRRVTGHDARDHLHKVVSLVRERDREVLRRIIARDLECGAGTTLPNRVWKKLIPEQPQCLATAYSEKALARIKYPAYSQLKADGARCFTDIIQGKAIRKSTRAGNEYEGLENLDAAIEKIRASLDKDYVIDGELIYVYAPVKATTAPKAFSLDSFMDEDAEAVEDITEEQEEIAEAKREKGNGIVNKSLKGTITHEEQLNIVYQVWDFVEYDVYYGDRKCEDGYEKRFDDLKAAIEAAGVGHLVQAIPTRIVHSFAEAKKDYNDYRNQGKEGSILKNMNFLWKDSRVADQVKLKNKTPIDLRIVAIYKHTKEDHKAGGFVVEDLSGDARTNTGSGLKDTDYRYGDDGETRVYIPLDERPDLDREYIMAHPEKYIGAIVEMEVDGLQTSETRKAGEPKYSFFLPIIKKMRYDKSEPNSIYDVFADLF